jgi:hypothetical protein
MPTWWLLSVENDQDLRFLGSNFATLTEFGCEAQRNPYLLSVNSSSWSECIEWILIFLMFTWPSTYDQSPSFMDEFRNWFKWIHWYSIVLLVINGCHIRWATDIPKEYNIEISKHSYAGWVIGILMHRARQKNATSSLANLVDIVPLDPWIQNPKYLPIDLPWIFHVPFLKPAWILYSKWRTNNCWFMIDSLIHGW